MGFFNSGRGGTSSGGGTANVSDSLINGEILVDGNSLQVYDDTTIKNDISDLKGNKHSHSNKIQLDRLGINASNKLTIDGTEVESGSTVVDSTTNGNIIVNGQEIKVYDDSLLSSSLSAKASIDNVTASATTTYSSSKINTLLSEKANSTHTHTLSDISDVDLTNKINGYALQYNSTTGKFESKALPTGGSGATSMSGLSDVDVTTTPPTDNQVLTYNNTTGKWVPETPTPSGGSNSPSSIYIIELSRWSISNNNTNAEATTKGLNDAITWASTNGYHTAIIPDGNYLIDGFTRKNVDDRGSAGILMPSNFNLILSENTVLKMAPNDSGGQGCQVIGINGVSNVTVRGGTIVGDREDHIWNYTTTFTSGSLNASGQFVADATKIVSDPIPYKSAYYSGYRLTPTGITPTTCDVYYYDKNGTYLNRSLGIIFEGNTGAGLTADGIQATKNAYSLRIVVSQSSSVGASVFLDTYAAEKEFAMCIGLISAKNVTIEGVTMVDSMGDCVAPNGNGSFLYGNYQPSENIVVRDCVLDSARRNNLSVVAGKDILIERCLIKDSGAFKYGHDGTIPKAGIDIEGDRYEYQGQYPFPNFLGTYDASTGIYPTVIDVTSTPPSSPVNGDKYIVGASATGAWAGQDNKVATYSGGSWIFANPTGANEISTLMVTGRATSSGNITVTLNDVPTNIAVTANDSPITIATKIRNTSFPGWTTGGFGTNVIFTATSYGLKTPTTFSGGSTGVSGFITKTKQGDWLGYYVTSKTRAYQYNGTSWVSKTSGNGWFWCIGAAGTINGQYYNSFDMLRYDSGVWNWYEDIFDEGSVYADFCRGENVIIRDCHFSGSRNGDINCLDGHYVIIEGNRFEGTVHTSAVNNCVIANNIFRNPSGNVSVGTAISTNLNTTIARGQFIQGNLISGYLNGISAGTHMQISGNTISECNSGIIMNAGTPIFSLSIVGNRIMRCTKAITGSGVLVDTMIDSNSLYDNFKTGIDLSSNTCHGTTVVNNDVKKSPIFASLGDGQINFVNNHYDGKDVDYSVTPIPPMFSIQGSGVNTKIAGNIISNINSTNSSKFDLTSIAGKVEFIDNKITDIGTSGTVLISISNNTNPLKAIFSNNIIGLNYTTDCWLLYFAGNSNLDVTVDNNTFYSFGGTTYSIRANDSQGDIKIINNKFRNSVTLYPNSLTTLYNNSINGIVDGFTAAPTLGYYTIGRRVYHSSPTTFEGWICVTTGYANNTSWTTGTNYALNAVVNSSGNVYQCITAGIAGATAPSGTTSSISDGGATWKYVGALAVFKTFGVISS